VCIFACLCIQYYILITFLDTQKVGYYNSPQHVTTGECEYHCDNGIGKMQLGCYGNQYKILFCELSACRIPLIVWFDF